MNYSSVWRMGLGFIIVLTLTASQGIRAGDLSLFVEGSYERPAGEVADRYNGELGPSIGLEYMYNPYLGFTTSAAYHNFDRSNDGRDLSVMHLVLDGIVAYPFLEKWRVYTHFGMGLYAWEADNAWWKDGDPDDGADIGYNIGAGVNYKLFDFMEITTSITHHDVEFEGNSESFHWMEVKTGVRFLIDFPSSR